MPKRELLEVLGTDQGFGAHEKASSGGYPHFEKFSSQIQVQVRKNLLAWGQVWVWLQVWICALGQGQGQGKVKDEGQAWDMGSRAVAGAGAGGQGIEGGGLEPGAWNKGPEPGAWGPVLQHWHLAGMKVAPLLNPSRPRVCRERSDTTQLTRRTRHRFRDDSAVASETRAPGAALTFHAGAVVA